MSKELFLVLNGHVTKHRCDVDVCGVFDTLAAAEYRRGGVVTTRVCGQTFDTLRPIIVKLRLNENLIEPVLFSNRKLDPFWEYAHE